MPPPKWAYYNEIEPYAVQWLRNLIVAGHIPQGEVDTRSITDVRPEDVKGFTQAHFFAGLGGWPYALRLAGWPDGAPVWSGSCPCQPFSTAGKGKGTADERHLWPEFGRLIGECRPPVTFGEQVASRAGRDWLALVRADLEGMGYAVAASDLCAASVGAPHIRQRLYWVADSDITRPQGRRVDRDGTPQRTVGSDSMADGGVVHADGAGPQQRHKTAPASRQRGAALAASWADPEWLPCTDGKARPTQPGVQPLAHGVPNRVGRLRAYGNAIVPQVAAAFIQAYLSAIESP